MKHVKWFLWAGVALLLAFMTQSPYAAFAIYTFLFLTLLAHFSTMAWLSGLDCRRTVNLDTVQQGDEVEVEVVVENNRGWPIPWIYFEDYHPSDFPRRGDNMRLSVLMPGRSVTMKYKLICPRRGYHRIGPLLMETGDLFGLQRRFRTGTQQHYVSVLPTIAYIETFSVATKRPQGPVRLTNRIYADPTRINSIREYVPGDALNTIHWKATARTGKLHVKTYEPSSIVGGTLILDMHDESYLPELKDERMELAITITASIAYLLQMSGEQVGLVTNAQDAAEAAAYEVEEQETASRYEADEAVEGEEESERINPLSVPTRRSPIQAQQIAENLARVLPGKGLDATGTILSEFRRLPRDATLLPVVPFVDERLALTLGSMKLSGFNVTVFLVKDPAGYQAAAQLLAQHNIFCFHIEHEWQLHEISPAKIS